MPPIRNRLDVPRWFGPEDGKFLREHITEEVWERIKLAHGKEAILDFCAEKGIPLKDVGMYWIKSPEYSVMVKGMKSEGGSSQEEIFQLIADKLGDYQIPTFQFAADGLQQKCAILNLYDAHLDKIALAAETGESSTIEDNVKRYHEGFDTLLNSVLAHDPEVIIFPLGNDFYHANDMTGKTKKGYTDTILGISRRGIQHCIYGCYRLHIQVGTDRCKNNCTIRQRKPRRGQHHDTRILVEPSIQGCQKRRVFTR
jgi:hypothetical protein